MVDHEASIALIAKSAAFLAANHLQGAATSGSVHLGLTDSTGTLVAVLSASTSRTRATILRYATSCIIPGGFARLEAALVAELPPNVSTLVMHVDVATGEAGPDGSDGWTSTGGAKPDYSYVVRDTRVHKSTYSQKRFRDDVALDHAEGLTVHELAALNGLPRIWDAGMVRWVKPVAAAVALRTVTPDSLDLAA
ncbi:MAG TPA: hypothetical protein VFC06_07800 [Demequina sp.]|nr:hypothetical protein [Demequina sp.]